MMCIDYMELYMALDVTNVALWARINETTWINNVWNPVARNGDLSWIKGTIRDFKDRISDHNLKNVW